MADDILTIEFDAEAALRAMQIAPARVSRAMVRALNRAGTSGRAEMARRVGRDMGMKTGDAKDAIFIQQASAQKLSVRLTASKRRRPLFDFQARQVAAGVSFRGEGGKRSLVAGAFLATVRAGSSGTHQGVFKRKGKSRLPIRELQGVSIGRVFARHRPAVIDVMQATFEKNIGSELAFASTENG